MFSVICRRSGDLSSRVFGLILASKNLESLRPLYTLSALGVDNYLSAREKVGLQFKDIAEKFKLKMKDYSNEGLSNMIFTEDLKNMIYLTQNTAEDIDLVERMLVKFSKQNKEMRFGSFVFGPVVMRMYYHLNKPNEALKMFKHPDMDGFFDQLMSFQILMDLLYKNEMYNEVLDVFVTISEKQLQASKYPKNAVVLALATCYKLNNEESLKFVSNLWTNLNEVGHYPMRRAGTFAAALAIKQKRPEIALEILTSMKQQSYVTIRNLKVAALSDLGRPDDALPILRSVLELDSPHGENKHTFCEDILEKVSSAIEDSTNNKIELKNEYDRIVKELKSLDFISKEPIDSLLCKEIDLHPSNKNKDRMPNYGRGSNQRGQYVQRPGLKSIL